jgi:pilus assembly protein CpaD
MRSSIAASAAMSAARLAVTVSLAAVALAGCRTVEETGAHVAGWSIIDASQRHPILVSQQPATLNIRVGSGAQGLSGAQVGQLSDFLARYRAMDSGNSKLVIAVPSGSANEGAAMRAVAHVRQIIQEFGFSESVVAMQAYSASREATAPIRLAYLRYVAQAPECGHWPTNLAKDPRALPYPNFGCAQQHNLAAQIANPADLLGPRTTAPSDAERRATIMDNYRQGRTTGAEKSADERSQVKGQ